MMGGLILAGTISVAQSLPLQNLLAATGHNSSRSENFITQKGFVAADNEYSEDTLIRTYYYKKRKKRHGADSIHRLVKRFSVGEDVSISYQTSCMKEFETLQKQLKKEGFVWGRSPDTGPESLPLLYQFRDITVNVTGEMVDSLNMFNFLFKRKILPEGKDIIYAEDLLAFNSHENLVHVFGNSNTKKDIYYFTEKEFSRCTVLFPNTDRQAVFVWKDEKNDCVLSHLVLGGQLMVQSALEYDKHIAQNSWRLKSQVHAGMSLRELRRLNGLDFRFHNVSSNYSGMVLPVKSGKIDFQKEVVVLACLNCQDLTSQNTPPLSADQAIAEGRRFFVFTIMLSPPTAFVN
ncbi:MAG TPA: hypothetical protein VFO70_09485 [Chitinophagaceae bacterium]|nr:hypothetical protein [Chitinophagaceae bacterium]